ncbi:bifunctional glycosyltransferase/CDP-glycerol:glycerophosphate glycerophosphotransferase [Plantactinospora endophytica]|uniref:Glycosyl transferase n=1 Tax=Plantactinospora endophytica TaxID=673535 RepID=A0ABQ4E7V7_9ACTN|nr:bifunctional glycosyltransferase family 2 protein/CDP-glycerol:glycerophosphate glycerophosphotransferase [Plantactinospora endophytica]GIG90798.1 glycosyl transferase [Plantactinospora endophytica]
MALISFVVPVYRVQGYLRECLDSILGQPVTDVEVLVVDDCSPDSCGEIIAEYADRDDRIRVVTLDRNVGLGEARNTGLALATGEYVWFLDSDDWLVDGCLAAVAERLRRVEPEVLVVDHVRAYWDDRVLASGLDRTMPDTGDEVFGVRDRPEVFEILHTAWNKVVRREFLLDAGLRFGPGWYEDVSFSYPVLLAACRISVLDVVCVNYRQRRSGAITRTRDDRHFEVFPHWHQVFALMARWGPEYDDLRPLIFERMVWHYLIVLGNGRRLSPELRRTFFARVAADYRRWLPPGGYRLPGGIDGLKHRLVAGGHWRTYAVLRALHHSRRGGARRLARGALPLPGPASAATRLPGPAYLARLPAPVARVAGVAREGLLRAYYQAQLRRPLDPTLALYAAYWYRGYACNPAAVHRKAAELAPEVRGVWVVRRDLVSSLPPGVPYVVAGSRSYFRALARASWLVNNVNFPDYVVKRPGAVHVQTHHGTPVKVMGLDQQRYPRGAAGLDFPGLLRRIDRWDYSVTANTFSTQMWERAYPAEYRTLEVGYPRNDRLVDAGPAEVEAVRRGLGIGPDERVLLYAPTHREHRPGYSPPFDPQAVIEVLGPAGRLLVRGHYLDPEARPGDAPAPSSASDGSDRVLDVTDHPSVEDLYLAADVLVTDYSSAMFDYATLDRPIVVYAPDWAEYRQERGVYLDVLAEAPGVAVTDFAELLASLRSGAAEGPAASRARAGFRQRFCALDDGRAAERVVRRVFLGEPD